MSDFVNRYDDMMQNSLESKYMGKSGFFNVGYWFSDTLNPEEACKNLVEKHLELIPKKKGIILDVACGFGATTNHLLKYYPASDIIAINISEQQLEEGKNNVLGCKFITVDAVNMDFEDNLFDSIICIDSAYHFDTRNDFLHEAWRVLKPGGHLVLSDAIFKSTKWIGDWMIPSKNNVEDIEKYKDSYIQTGFQDVELVDITNQSWKECCRHIILWFQNLLGTGELDEKTFHQYMLEYDGLQNHTIKHYLLVSAKKP